MRAVLLEETETFSVWLDSLAGPALMPVRPTVCRPASSFRVIGLRGSRVGKSLMALMVTVKVRVTVLLLPCPSLTRTVIITGPAAAVLAFSVGVKVKAPVVLGEA